MSKNTEQRFTIPDPAELQRDLPKGTKAEDLSASSSVGRILKRHQERLMRLDGVVMVGEGEDQIGRPAIVIGVRQRHHLKRIPAQVDGVAVVASVIGEVDALGR
jgi:hypothetical protein